MIENLKLYKIDMKYVRNLAKVDDNVMSVSPQVGKDIRPFVGILLLVNGKKYCIPLSSPKAKYQSKKNTVDFMRILDLSLKDEHGANKVIGALNFNNMLPATENLLTEIDIKIHKGDSAAIISYKNLLTKQLDWCQKNEANILKKANKLYALVTEHPEENCALTRRCCNFKKLETILTKWHDKQLKETVQASSISALQKPTEKLSFSEMISRKTAEMRKEQMNRSSSNNTVQKKKNNHHR